METKEQQRYTIVQHCNQIVDDALDFALQPKASRWDEQLNHWFAFAVHQHVERQRARLGQDTP